MQNTNSVTWIATRVSRALKMTHGVNNMPRTQQVYCIAGKGGGGRDPQAYAKEYMPRITNMIVLTPAHCPESPLQRPGVDARITDNSPMNERTSDASDASSDAPERPDASIHLQYDSESSNSSSEVPSHSSISD